MREYRIAVIPGDGIGPEIIAEAVKVLEVAGSRFGLSFDFQTVLAGGCAIDACGEPLPQETVNACLASDSVLLGAVGGPQWDSLPGSQRPERALLGLRSALGLFTNLRPAILYPALRDACPLKEDVIGNGLDVLVVRELTGGIYFGEHGRKATEGGEAAYDVEQYSEAEVERIGRVAFEMAQKRQGRLCSVDKANVLESSRLWRQVMHRLSESYPDVAYSDMFVDNCAMQLVRNPGQFDVIVTSNLFGDILSDEASMLTGSIGMLPSASLGSGRLGMYEPIHGSAPDIAGQNLANPIATIASAAMLLRYSLGEGAAADAIEAAINQTLDAGYRTADIRDAATSPTHLLSTSAMGDKIAACL